MITLSVALAFRDMGPCRAYLSFPGRRDWQPRANSRCPPARIFHPSRLRRTGFSSRRSTHWDFPHRGIQSISNACCAGWGRTVFVHSGRMLKIRRIYPPDGPPP